MEDSSAGKDAKPAAPAKTPKPGKSSPASRIEPGPLEKAFRILSRAGLPVLLLMALLPSLHLAFGVAGPESLQGQTEAAVYEFIRQGQWWNLALGGAPFAESFPYHAFPPSPTIYYWLLYGLDLIPGVDAPALFALGAAVSGMLFIGAVWVLARATGHGRRAAFASGLAALGCYCLLCLFQIPGPGLFSATILTLALGCFFRGWRKDSAPLWLTLAFLLTGLSILCGGPFGLLVIVPVSVLFVFWLGRPGRLNGKDGQFGFFLMLIIPALWLGLLLHYSDSSYVKDVLAANLRNGFSAAGTPDLPWWAPAAALAVLWMPWTLLVLFINWLGAARGLPAMWKARRENGGGGWLWLILLVGLAWQSLAPGRNVAWLLPLVPALAVLTGRSLLRLSPGRSRCFFLFLAVLCVLKGLLLIALQFDQHLLPLLPPEWAGRIPDIARDVLQAADGLLFLGLSLLALGLGLIFLVRRPLPGGTLLLFSLAVLAMFQIQTFMVTPSLKAFFPLTCGTVLPEETGTRPANAMETPAEIQDEPDKAQPEAVPAPDQAGAGSGWVKSGVPGDEGVAGTEEPGGADAGTGTDMPYEARETGERDDFAATPLPEATDISGTPGSQAGAVSGGTALIEVPSGETPPAARPGGGPDGQEKLFPDQMPPALPQPAETPGEPAPEPGPAPLPLPEPVPDSDTDGPAAVAGGHDTRAQEAP